MTASVQIKVRQTEMEPGEEKREKGSDAVAWMNLDWAKVDSSGSTEAVVRSNWQRKVVQDYNLLTSAINKLVHEYT